VIGELRLEAQDFTGSGRWRWVLTGPGGEFLADHEARLDTRCWQFEAFTGLAGYLRWRASPDRRLAHEAEIVTGVGAWIGEQVLGPVGAAMAAARPATVRVIVPADPPEAAHLMFVPLELGHSGGRPLAAQNVTLVMQRGADGSVPAVCCPPGVRSACARPGRSHRCRTADSGRPGLASAKTSGWRSSHRAGRQCDFRP
jgi:hypothetical protein